VFLTILEIFSFEVTLIRDQGWFNVGAYTALCVQYTFKHKQCMTGLAIRKHGLKS